MGPLPVGSIPTWGYSHFFVRSATVGHRSLTLVKP